MGQTAIDYNDVPFGRGAFRMYGKPNDYQYYKFFEDRPKDGSHASRNAWTLCVNQGVVTIQRLLKEVWGFDQEISGEYGKGTKRHIAEFQTAHGLSNEGITGPWTAQALVKPVIKSTAADLEIKPKYLHAFASLESGYDPGAQGVSHPTDLGLWQHNVEDTDTSDVEAFDYQTACTLAGRRFKVALADFAGKGAELQEKCAIAQHNWPVGAELWYTNENPPTPEIENYVNLVLARAKAWR